MEVKKCQVVSGRNENCADTTITSRAAAAAAHQLRNHRIPFTVRLATVSAAALDVRTGGKN